MTEPRPSPSSGQSTDRLQVTIERASRMLDMSSASVRRMLERGELPSTGRGRLRRIPVTALRRWVEQNTSRE